MTRIVAVANQKGGVGKTTTSINLSASLAAQGQKVLLVDMDPQGNAGSGLGVRPKRQDKTIYHVLLEMMKAEACIHKSELQGLDIIPSNTQLIGAEVELVSAIARETILRRALKGLQGQYDYIMLDCPPSIGLLTVNALTAAHGVVVPLQCEYYALEGLSHLHETIQLIHRSLNPDLVLEGILLTMFDGRNNLCRQVAAETKKHFGTKVYDTIIPRNIRLSEAPSHAKPILLYDEMSRGAQAYMSLAKEIVERQGRFRKLKPKKGSPKKRETKARR